MKDNLPLRTSEKEGFRRFAKAACPLYNPPGRTTVTSLMDEKYEALFPFLKQKMATISHIALTKDLWTEPNNTTSILGITAHYYYN